MASRFDGKQYVNLCGKHFDNRAIGGNCLVIAAIRDRVAQYVRHMRAHFDRDLIEQHEAGRFGQVRCIDRRPERGDIVDLFGDQERLGDIVKRAAFLLRQFKRVDQAKPVDDPVGQFGRDDFAAQAMRPDRCRVSFAHLGWEGVEKVRQRSRVSRQAARFDGGLQFQLGSGHDDRQFGPGQPLSICRAAVKFFISGNPLNDAVKLACCLQLLDQAEL
jgi:hypothetical protein